VLMQYGRSKSNGELALDYGFVEGHSMGSSIRESLSLTLEISETDRFADDKLDIAELNGLDRSVQFDLVRGQGPPDTMLTFLRLTSLTGADAFLLEVCLHAIATHIVQLVAEMGSCTSRNGMNLTDSSYV
jgi:[ribulose-bisphosphate carboxylase]-lysine N-methyltransferase